MKNDETSERLLEQVKNNYPERGKFGLLEEMTGVPSDRWKNFWYGKQSATEEMLKGWLKAHPDDESWIRHGKIAPHQSEWCFGTPIPQDRDMRTIGDRLNWVIKEWASPVGQRLFSYLAEKSNGKVSADEWAKVVMGLAQPSAEMVSIVCSRRLMFVDWVLFGTANSSDQVDPTDQESVQQWKKSWRESIKNEPEKTTT